MSLLKVTMMVQTNDDGQSIKDWTHHIDYAIDMNEYPEIESIFGVQVEEVNEN